MLDHADSRLKSDRAGACFEDAQHFVLVVRRLLRGIKLTYSVYKSHSLRITQLVTINAVLFFKVLIDVLHKNVAAEIHFSCIPTFLLHLIV